MGEIRLKEREFIPGSTGWTAQDLNHPEVERLWETNSYELIEGVLANMPPALFDGNAALLNLVDQVKLHLNGQGVKNAWASEADFIVSDERIAKPDAMMLLESDLRRQRAANAKAVNLRKTKYGRIRVAPTLIIESVSLGHEKHDRDLKRRWYAEFGVKNYWLLDAYRKTLECLILDRGHYRLDVKGRKSDKIRPSAFQGLVISLGTIWE